MFLFLSTVSKRINNTHLSDFVQLPRLQTDVYNLFLSHIMCSLFADLEKHWPSYIFIICYLFSRHPWLWFRPTSVVRLYFSTYSFHVVKLQMGFDCHSSIELIYNGTKYCSSKSMVQNRPLAYTILQTKPDNKPVFGEKCQLMSGNRKQDQKRQRLNDGCILVVWIVW